MPRVREGVHLGLPLSALSLGRRTSISGCRACLGTAPRASASISSSETDLLWVFIFLLLFFIFLLTSFLLLAFTPLYSIYHVFLSLKQAYASLKR